MILNQIPGILKNKFEFLGIHKTSDLIEKYDKLISIPGFGKKCIESLAQYVFSIADIPEDFKTKIKVASAPPTVEPLKSHPLNRFTQTLSGDDEPFFVEIPKILEEKFKALNIYSPNDLIKKYQELTSYRSFGKKCEITLEDFLTSCCDFYDRLNDSVTPTESDISSKYLSLFADFLSSHDPRFTVIYERRILNQSSSLDEIASIYEISKERIRQLESSFYKKTKSLLLGKSASKLIATDIQVVNAFTQIAKHVSENEVVGEFQLKTFASKFQRDGFTDQQWNHMKAAFKLIGIPSFKISLSDFAQTIYVASELNPEKLCIIAKSIISILQERITPVDRITLIIEVKKSLGRNISNDSISKLAETLECVDVNGQFFQMKLRYFTSASDMAVAVLDKHKAPLHFNEIFREINHTLIKQGGTPYEGNTSGAITKNPNMKPLGKTGKWVLEEWGVDTRGLSQRIIENFHHLNRPLSIKEIYTADSIAGVYPEHSVRTYMDMGLGKDYLTTDDGKYILASWQNSYEIDCDGVSRYDKQIWHERLKCILGDMTLSTKEISDKYEEMFSEPIGVINVGQRLKRSPCLQKTLSGGTNTWKWIKEYTPAIRITKTMVVSDAILKHLHRFPEKSAKLSDIRDYICSKQDIPPASFYSIIDDDERFLKFKGENGATFVKVYEYQAGADAVLNESSQKILQLLAIGENDKVEFKSSLQWDIKESRKNTELHNEVIKTVCAFANTSGGILFIGVDDNSNILGLEPDYALFSKENKKDAFHLALSNIFDRSFDRDFCVGIDRKILQIEDNDICVIEVKPAPNPIFAKTISRQNAAPLNNVFFIRDNNRTLMITDNIELLQYVKRKWG